MSVLLAAALAVFCRLTRFENQLRVNYTPPTLRITIHGNPFSLELPNLDAREIAVRMQKSAADEVVLRSVKLEEPGKELLSSHWSGLYFAGRDLFGTFGKGNYPTFTRTLGDWWTDRYLSIPQVLYSGGLLDRGFDLSVTSIGRGSTQLLITGNEQVQLSFDDGLMGNGLIVERPRGGQQYYFSVERARDNLFRVLNIAAEAGLIALLLSFIVRLFFSPEPKPHSLAASRPFGVRPGIIVAVAAAAHFLVCLWFALRVLGGIPHIPDSDNYYRIAVMLARGMLAAPLPTGPFEAFRGTGGIIIHGALTYFYNYFWPAVLGVFVFLKIPSFANPLISACTVLLVFLLGRRLFDQGTALLAALLYACIPYAIVMSGDFMLHPLTQACIIAAMYCCLRAEEDGKWCVLLAGFLGAYSFALRQLTAAAMLAPFALYMLRRSGFRGAFKYTCWGFTGALPVLVLYLLNNRFLTGSLFTSPYVRWHALGWSFDYFDFSLNWQDSTLALLPATFLALPFAAKLSLCLPMLIFALRPRVEDLMLSAMFLCLFASYCFINSHGLHGYGPRFLFESVFVLVLLSARGLRELFQRASVNLKLPLAALGILALLYNGAVTARSLPKYRNYNHIKQELFHRLETLDLARTVVVVKDNGDWWDLGVSAKLFDPEYKQGVFIKTLPQDNHRKALEHFRDREAVLLQDGKFVPLEKEDQLP